MVIVCILQYIASNSGQSSINVWFRLVAGGKQKINAGFFQVSNHRCRKQGEGGNNLSSYFKSFPKCSTVYLPSTFQITLCNSPFY